jgi:lysophospholipase L1-like esterase
MTRTLLALVLSASVVPCLAQRKNPAFQNPTDDPALPRVLLIGDSISIGYTAAVRKELKGEANVHRIPTNGGPTTRGLESLSDWLGDGKWDVIHFNWGLHDLAYRNPAINRGGNLDKVKGTLSTPLEDYAANLDKLVVRMKKTGAKLIFATTTPVPEGEPGRKVGDDLRYNEAAVAVMKKHGVTVNDLHAVMADRMGEFGTRPGNVHFKPEGSAMLARQVAKVIREALEE